MPATARRWSRGRRRTGRRGRATLVLSQLIYREGIAQGEFGYASAISLVLFVIVLLVTVLQFRLGERKDR